MYLKKISPSKSLSHIVEYYWILTGKAGDSARHTFRIVADANPGIVFSLAKSPFITICPLKNEEYTIPELFIYGTTDKHIDVSVVGDFFLFGIRFTPWAFYHLDGIPSCRIVNQTIPLNNIFDRIGKALKIKMINQRDFEKQIDQVNDFLEHIQRQRKKINSITPPQLDKIFRGNVDMKVAEITDQCMLSRRQIERNFRAVTGVSPKKYLRIARFQKALKTISGVQKITDVAYALGYSDQAHFTKEFKSHSGLTPKEYFFESKFSLIVDSFLKIEES